MKKLFVSVICLALVSFGMAAAAAAFSYDMGAGSYVDVSQTGDPGLVMWADVNPALGDIMFDLAVGQSYTFGFARIGTNEEWVNPDDTAQHTVTAYLDFDNPDILGSVGGTSAGYIRLGGFIQGWNLRWNDPVILSFGNTGSFAIDLSDARYIGGIFGPDGSDYVTATVTHLADPAAVPEPATLLLLGAGLTGLALTRRRMKRDLKQKLVTSFLRKGRPQTCLFSFHRDNLESTWRMLWTS